MKRTKEEQIRTAFHLDGMVFIDVTTNRYKDVCMICDEVDYIKWKDNNKYGRIYAWQARTGTYPYGVFTDYTIKRGTPYYFHRLVAPFMDHIDHIDRNGLNNCIENFRDGSQCINEWNRLKQSNNKSGFKGVSFRKDRSKYKAMITAYGKHKYLGLFDTPEEASKRYILAEKRRWEGFELKDL